MEMSQKDLLILDNSIDNKKKMYYMELYNRGIQEPELSRAVQAEFENEMYSAEPWPGPVTGMDLAGNINFDLIFSSRTPEIFPSNIDSNNTPYPTSSINPYPNNPTPDTNNDSNDIKSNTYNIHHVQAEHSDNYTATGNQINSQPPSVGVEGFASHRAIPEFRYPVERRMMDITIPGIIIEPSGVNETIQDKEKKKSLLKQLFPYIGMLGAGLTLSQLVNDYMDKSPNSITDKSPKDTTSQNKYFTYTPMKLIAEFTLSSSHTGKDVCDDYAGKTFDLLDTSNRPILPSEGKGYTELVHPNCHCTWKIVKESKVSTLNSKQKTEFKNIKSHIKKAAKNHTLHTVKADGSLSQRTRGTNPIKEAIGKIRHQVKWLSDEYITKAKDIAKNDSSVLYLIRAATETITDHRSEGELHRRKLAGKELNSMARTAIGNNMDINHNPKYSTGGVIIDSEYDVMRKEIQMLVIESDDVINQFIKNGQITAVSINGGEPRTQNIEKCNENCTSNTCEMCNVPEGVILGETDGIALTWVVTAPQGIMYHGDHISQATPGISNTVIEIL